MRQTGATLLELMGVLAVAAILLLLAIPGLGSLRDSSRLTAASNLLVSSLHLTRSEAIKRNARAVMCTSSTGVACDSAGGWHQGWLVFHDANKNGTLDGGESVIHSQAPLPPGVRLTGNQPVARYISYSPTGATRLVSGAFQAGTLTVCMQSAGPTAARQVILSSTGRPRTLRTTLGNCL